MKSSREFPKVFLIGAVMLPLVLLAEEPAQLPEVVVTGARLPVKKDTLTSAVTVITRKDIERQQARTLPEVLRGVSGIDIVDNGGFGKVASVFMRGTNADHVLVLIDGIRAGSATAGTPTFENYPIELIERIEIVRGPQASLYGSEAIGGVIQIFSRKGKGPARASFSAGGGSYDSYRASGSVSGEYKNLNYSLTIGRFDTQGINARQPTPGPFGVNEPDRDGYNNTSIGARLGYIFNNGAEIEAFWLRAFGRNKFDSNNIAFPDNLPQANQDDYVEQVAGGKLKFKPLSFWQSSLRIGQSQDEGHQLLPNGQLSSLFDTTRWDMGWQNDFTLAPEQILTAGVDYRHDSVDAIVDINDPLGKFTTTARDNVGIFGLYTGGWEGLHWNGSVRWDKNSNKTAGDFLTGSLGVNYRFTNGIRLLAQFGRAFKTPTFNELYYPNFGNPNLRPEDSYSYEAGIEGEHGFAHWGLRFYRNEIDNLISLVNDPLSPIGLSPTNIDKARIDGIEAEGGITLAGWDARLVLNWLEPENISIRPDPLSISNSLTGKYLPRRAKEMLSFDLSKQFGQWYTGMRIIAQGDRFDDADNKIKVAGFVTVDLRAEYILTKNLSLRGTLKNLFNKNYETVKTYNQPGRNFFISLHYQLPW